MAIYFVDGDNHPGERTIGIEQLKPEEKVIVCYGEGNTYYINSKNQISLGNATKASVEFHKIRKGSNSADFAVAIKAGMEICKTSEDIFLVSEDKHFDTIASILQGITEGKRIVTKIQTIYESFFMKPKNVDSLSDALSLLKWELGDKYGEAFYNRLEELFAEEFNDNTQIDEAKVKVVVIDGRVFNAGAGRHKRLSKSN